ncbi:hypothetical protein RSOLAG1IB_03124 [Rhizoctonia solani AG-1 IB]|uniref:Uncharacterized protein n=1 Tax=Thanatephorus cucumeris (strain AG1-IB / isolate 7/3/14) TaxID=1108050 RepID=A0A0B7FQ68_THACB|nr:hypothetical protein RSOLAG1IB_03124 [Rhizoctonia solani AG-1 IB]
MSIPRATQCLVTLSKKLEVARLVYSFFLALPPRQFLRPFYAVLDRALGNMSNLQELSLILGLPITRNFPKVEAISKELTKLTCYTHTQDPHFLPSLLLDQPGIEELNILCGPAAIANLSPEALPALKCLHSPIWLLPMLLPSRLSHLSRLVIQEPMNSDADLRELSTALEEGTSPESMELDICMDLASCLMTPEIVSLGLSVLGSRAPFIHHLTVRLRGPIQQDQLLGMFSPALPSFSSLGTLIITPQLPTPELYYPPEYVQAQSQCNQAGDVFHDTLWHRQVIREWRRTNPALACVIFPIGKYIHVGRGSEGSEGV